MKWDYRGTCIVEEIIRAEADIACLEEVDHYKDFFAPKLSGHGFDGIFFPKVDSPCLEFPVNNGPDGCALFYKTDKFEFIRKKELVLKNTKGEPSHQVALLAEFKARQESQEVSNGKGLSSLVVAVTHLKAKTEAKELRAAQGKHLIEEITVFSDGRKQQAVVVAGDFNAPPNEKVYEHFSDSDAHPDLKLKSSYKEGPSWHRGKEPPFTSWKFRSRGEAKYTIDYIWYSPETLDVVGVWEVPKEEEIGENGLPCMGYPSDHVALCTNFAIKCTSSI